MSSLPWSTEPMSDLLSTRTTTDSEAASGLPSAAQFFRLESEAVPFAVAQDEFARFITTNLLLAECVLLAVYDLFHRFFLLRDAPFRDQLCDILVAKPVHPGAVMRDLTHRLNTLLTDVEELSFSINTEHIGTEPHETMLFLDHCSAPAHIY
ncbi:hypothetical protein AMAG_18465 [Allomyces macrogynus ATCC 38327]|uniref:Uncharacterized protein n=1 Tax=Allomyces macrogynus (strain ATCC 38327) TaxID=578462 RepID=A0A0L0SCA4_ALLM3|nr:hypothetical protein AMAG_18465 [Allomyces macrogynus ATCC 38327]|eukprot:KNE60067.1 hypothetical protein AMAG_18465 [Allomyces macrogynus ATCC 38327]